MLRNLQDRLKSVGNSLESLNKLLEDYRDYRGDLKRQLNYYDTELKAELAKVPDVLIEFVKERGTEILIRNALTAIENTKEFNLPEFKNRLIDAIKDSRTISIDGDSYFANIKINLGVTAGTLRDYLDGVNIARGNLGLGETWNKTHRASGEDLASRIWREKIYGSARESRKIVRKRKLSGDIDLTSQYARQYERTIAERLNAIKTKAPWWYIINYGTPEVEGGGDPYPAYAGQRFVENSEAEILSAYRQKRRELQDKIYDLYNGVINSTVDLIDIIDRDIDEIIRLIAKLEEFNLETDVEIAIRAIVTRLVQIGKNIDDAQPSKILELAYSFVEGTPISTIGERVTLGVGIRVRTIELRRMFEEEISARINN